MFQECFENVAPDAYDWRQRKRTVCEKKLTTAITNVLRIGPDEIQKKHSPVQQKLK